MAVTAQHGMRRREGWRHRSIVAGTLAIALGASLGALIPSLAGSLPTTHGSVGSTWSSNSVPGASFTAGGFPAGNLGVSVSLSADGTTALVGASAASNQQGAAYIFRASANGTWSSSAVPMAALSAPGLTAGDLFADSVALSADGTTAIVGANGKNQSEGTAYIFHVASEASWTSTASPTAVLSDPQAIANDRFGVSTGISADGTTALVGAENANSGDGAAYVFHVAAPGAWTNTSSPSATLSATGHPAAIFGSAAALSSDGTTALIGGFHDQGGTGAAFVFHTPSAASWTSTTQPTAVLTRAGGTIQDGLATVVALSGDGTTALASSETGAAYLFHVGSEGSWTTTATPTAALTNGGGSSDFDFGVGLAFSSDGSIAIVGDDAVPDPNFVGAAYVFQVPSASSWSGQLMPTASLTNAAGTTNDGLGSDVSLSADGQVAFVGADGANGGAGVADVFDRVTVTSSSLMPTQSLFGQTVTFSASVMGTGGPPSGTVTFAVGTTTLCVGSLSGGATSCPSGRAPLGNDTVTATYDGDPNFDTSSATSMLVVGPAATRAGPSVAPTADDNGYWLSNPDGSVRAFGDAGLFGSMQGQPLNGPIVGIAGGPGSQGYWLVGSDGGVFAFGDSAFFGSMGAQPLNQPIVGITATPDGQGYWLVAADGGVFAFGDAGFFGSAGGLRLNQPVVDLTANPDGHGYWLVASDGGVFAFGDAGFLGSMGNTTLNQPIVGIDATPDGAGYWLVAFDGGVFAFGDAGFFGSTGAQPISIPVIGLIPTATDQGYRLIDGNGGSRLFGT